MTRLKKYRINKDHLIVPNINTKTRNLVECKCALHCHGSKLVDPRTFKRHQQELVRLRSITSDYKSSHRLRNTRRNQVDIGSSTSKEKEVELVKQFHDSFGNFSNDETNQNLIYIPKK